MNITITSTGFSLDGPLVAGEKVAVSVSGIQFAEGSTPTLALLARFPDALLSSAELAEDENTPGTWTGELDTATRQTAFFFATARADERRDAVLELVDTLARRSVARLTVPFVNSSLCPSPFGAKDASPVFVATPGPQGDSATVEIGETSTLPSGSDATVENAGTETNAVLKFGIPQGPTGPQGAFNLALDQPTLDQGSGTQITIDGETIYVFAKHMTFVPDTSVFLNASSLGTPHSPNVGFLVELSKQTEGSTGKAFVASMFNDTNLDVFFSFGTGQSGAPIVRVKPGYGVSAIFICCGDSLAFSRLNALCISISEFCGTPRVTGQ